MKNIVTIILVLLFLLFAQNAFGSTMGFSSSATYNPNPYGGIDLESNIILSVPESGFKETISGNIGNDPNPPGDYPGPYSLTKSGNGTLVLSGSNTYTGGTNVLAGTLIIDSSNAIQSGTSLTVGAGGTFIFDPSVTSSPATSYGIQASPNVGTVPEPNSILLLLSFGITAFLFKTFYKKSASP